MDNNYINPNRILPKETFLVCICKEIWRSTLTQVEAIIAPVYGEIVTYDGEHPDFGFLYLKEYNYQFEGSRSGYDKTYFRLATEEEIKKHIASKINVDSGEFVNIENTNKW